MPIRTFKFVALFVFCFSQLVLAERPTQQPVPATSDLECASSDLKCLGNRAGAEAMCSDLLEDYLNEQQKKYKWISNKQDLKFTQIDWLEGNRESGQTTYFGDKLLILASSGLWVNYRYQCDIDKDTEYILAVRFEPGKMIKASRK